jgi:hypothetical protein
MLLRIWDRIQHTDGIVIWAGSCGAEHGWDAMACEPPSPGSSLLDVCWSCSAAKGRCIIEVF